MAANIRDIVGKEIAQLRNEVAREEAVLASLKADLKTREGIYRFLASGATPRKSVKPVGAKRADTKQNTAAK